MRAIGKEVDDALNALLTRLGDARTFRCTAMSTDGKACLQQHENARDKQGRTLFFYATDCKLVQTFCASCLTYWHVAVARNCLIRHERFEAEMKAEMDEINAATKAGPWSIPEKKGGAK